MRKNVTELNDFQWPKENKTETTANSSRQMNPPSNQSHKAEGAAKEQGATC